MANTEWLPGRYLRLLETSMVSMANTKRPRGQKKSYDVVMLVGAGIGVTPFASILRTVSVRATQRKVLSSFRVIVSVSVCFSSIMSTVSAASPPPSGSLCRC